MNGRRGQLARCNNLFHLNDRYPARRCHRRIKILRGMPIDNVAVPVRFPALDEREISGDGLFQDVVLTCKLARFFAVSEEFKTLWHQRNDVRGVENQLKLFTHPELGDFTLQQMYWYSAPRNGSRLLVYLPVDEAGERAMEWLAERGAV